MIKILKFCKGERQQVKEDCLSIGLQSDIPCETIIRCFGDNLVLYKATKGTYLQELIFMKAGKNVPIQELDWWEELNKMPELICIVTPWYNGD